MVADIRYGNDSNENALIRAALAKEYNFRCYMCNLPSDFSTLEIDHIVLKTASAQELANAKANFGLPSDFDVNGLENLALICRPCNGKKGATDISKVPIFAIQLQKSKRNSKTIAKHIWAMKAGQKATSALAEASQVDTTLDANRQVVRIYAPIIVQKLAHIDPSLIDYLTSYDLQHSTDANTLFRIVTNNTMRSVFATTKMLLGFDIDAVLPEILDAARSDTFDLVKRALKKGPNESEGPIDIDPGSIGALHLEFIIDSARLKRNRDYLDFALSGSVDGYLSAPVVAVSYWDPRPIQDRQADAFLSGPVEIEFSLAMKEELVSDKEVFNLHVALDALAIDIDW